MWNADNMVRASLTVFRSLVHADSEGTHIYLRDRNNDFWRAASPLRRPTGPHSLVEVDAEVLGQGSKGKKPGPLVPQHFRQGSICRPKDARPTTRAFVLSEPSKLVDR